MSNINSIELALNDIRAVINTQNLNAEAVMLNTTDQIDALIENHRVSIKLLEELKHRMTADHAAQSIAFKEIVGDGNHA